MNQGFMSMPVFSDVARRRFFFRHPNKTPVVPGDNSTFCLLRRDLNTLSETSPKGMLWPRAMIVMAGIDLMAKFKYNSDRISRGAIGKRYIDFCHKYIVDSGTNRNRDADLMWQLRNAMLHSFGVYSDKGTGHRFLLDYAPGNLLIDINAGGRYVINLKVLFKRFQSSIIQFNQDATANPNQLTQQMFDKYGFIHIA